MARVLLFSVQMSILTAAITQPGCIVPVPLEAQSVVANVRPVIVTGELIPTWDKAVVHSVKDAFEFTVVAEDPNIDDTLAARMLRDSADGKSRVALYDINELSFTGDANAPTRRSGTFTARPYCDIIGSGRVYVRVSDSPFSNFTDDQTAGLSNDVFWDLQCQ